MSLLCGGSVPDACTLTTSCFSYSPVMIFWTLYRTGAACTHGGSHQPGSSIVAATGKHHTDTDPVQLDHKPAGKRAA